MKQKSGSARTSLHSVNSTASYDLFQIQCKSRSSFLSQFWGTSSGEVKVPWGGAMGCGGSRTDALEPRYLESWTKETESTWLTSTDTDIPLSSIQSIPSENSEASFTSEKTISPGKKNVLLCGWADGWVKTSLIFWQETCSNLTDKQLRRMWCICSVEIACVFFFLFIETVLKQFNI